MDCTPTDIFHLDVVVVGAGPTGLACGIDAKRAGFTVANIDKGCLVNSLFNYPSNMTFFTTPELLEIGDIPFSSPTRSPPARRHWSITARSPSSTNSTCASTSRCMKIEGSDNNFVVHTTNIHGHRREYHARKLILATGYYDRPNTINVPGRRSAEGNALLSRAASVLRAERADHRRQEFGRHCRAGAVAPRRERSRWCIAGRASVRR